MSKRTDAIAAAKLELLIDSIVLAGSIHESDIAEARRELRPLLTAVVTSAEAVRRAREMLGDVDLHDHAYRRLNMDQYAKQLLPDEPEGEKP